MNRSYIIWIGYYGVLIWATVCGICLYYAIRTNSDIKLILGSLLLFIIFTLASIFSYPKRK